MSERIQVMCPISPGLRPLHPDSSNRRPSFITNGHVGKGQYALDAGIPVLRMSPELKRATAQAEDEFHDVVADGIIGPAFVNGLPYSLVLAMEKLDAAQQVLSNVGNTDSYFVNDATYRLVIPSANIDVTIHKKKKPGDVEKVVNLLKLATDVPSSLSSVASLVRFDERSHRMEGFTSEAQLGQVRMTDVETVANRLESDKIHALGMPTPEAAKIFAGRPPFIPVTFTKYFESNRKIKRLESGVLIRPETLIYPTATELPYQLAGLGFIL